MKTTYVKGGYLLYINIRICSTSAKVSAYSMYRHKVSNNF